MNTIHKELEAFDNYLQLKNYSIATRKSYGCCLKQFLHWRSNSSSLDQYQARQYILYRYDQGLKWQRRKRPLCRYARMLITTSSPLL